MFTVYEPQRNRFSANNCFFKGSTNFIGFLQLCFCLWHHYAYLKQCVHDSTNAKRRFHNWRYVLLHVYFLFILLHCDHITSECKVFTIYRQRNIAKIIKNKKSIIIVTSWNNHQAKPHNTIFSGKYCGRKTELINKLQFTFLPIIFSYSESDTSFFTSGQGRRVKGE